jgi:hypothetical protein
LQACLDYLKKVGPADLNEGEFKSECGLGVVVSQEEIVKAVADLLKEKREELLEKRFNQHFQSHLLHSFVVSTSHDHHNTHAPTVKQSIHIYIHDNLQHACVIYFKLL